MHPQDIWIPDNIETRYLLGHLPQSDTLGALEQVFIKDLFPSILTSLPVPDAEKHPHSMMLPPPCFIIGMVPVFLQI
jgi:hypothetical protein